MDALGAAGETSSSLCRLGNTLDCASRLKARAAMRTRHH